MKRLDSIEKKIKGLAKSGRKVQIQNSLDLLSKRYSDRTPYKLSADQGFEAGNFLEGLTGARIDGQGNAEVARIKVREFAQFAELIVNRQTTIEGDQLYSEGDTIEEVIPNADGTYTLRLHAEWDGYTTGQFANNVCRGIYNDITKGSGFGGQGSGVTHLHNATYYTSWFRVLTVNPAANTIDVVLYADDEVPAGKNFPPMAMMKFARWGNSGAADNADFAMRQSVILISSTEGRIMQLVNVTKPIIDIGNVAFIQGKLPEIITDRDARLSPGEIALYVKTIVAQQNITMSHLMRPTPTLVFVGPYDPDGEYLSGDTYDEESGIYPRHIVEQNGCQWVCSKSGTKQEPSYTSTDWTFYLGDKILRVDFQEIDSLVDLENPECPLTMEAWYMGQNVTDSIAIYYDWMRESWRNGKQDTASDALWNDAHKNAGPALVLDGADMNFQFGSAPEKLIFTVTAILNDPSNPKLKPSMAQYYMI